MTGYLITAAAIGAVFCAMAIWPSIRRSGSKEGQ